MTFALPPAGHLRPGIGVEQGAGERKPCNNYGRGLLADG